MGRIKYVSVHENQDGERKIMLGKWHRTHKTDRVPTPENDLEGFSRDEWERVAVFDLPKSMPEREFTDWWNDNLGGDDEPDVIDSFTTTGRLTSHGNWWSSPGCREVVGMAPCCHTLERQHSAPVSLNPSGGA